MNEINLSLFGGRLKEARKKLGINQSEAADLVGVSREHWGRCERGLGMPGGEVLAALANAGADVIYILTGQRSAFHAALGHVRTASEMAQKLGGSNADMGHTSEALFDQLNRPTLSPDEQMLLDTYRRCTREAKANLIQTAALLSAGMAAPGAAPDAPSMGNNNQVNSASGAVQVKGSRNTVMSRTKK